MELGLIGLPNSGKTTVFNAITRADVEVTAYANPKAEPNFAIVEGYARRFGLDDPKADILAEANEWSVTRGARSGRVAWQFIQDLAGRLGKQTDAKFGA